jgi:hypothetical protein
MPDQNVTKLLADYHAAVESFEAASKVLLERFESRELPTPAEVSAEESARARLIVARQLLWGAWSRDRK